jgi:nicotinamidase-related amidase
MPIDPTPHLDPTTTAVIALEVQENLLLPEKSVLPGLARSAEEIGLIENLEALLESARSVGVRVFYVTDQRRKDGFGHATNTLVHRHMTGERKWSGGHGPIVEPLTPRPEDVLIERAQGMTGFFTTPLDAYLRNTGVRSVILTGISANVAVVGTAIEAMNRGYQVLVASDCIAGDPPEYVDQLLRYTIRNIAIVVPSSAITQFWKEGLS